MLGLLRKYTHWLHTRWPAGHVERLPLAESDGRTNVFGVYLVGDLKGVPLLKFSSDSGARAVQAIVAEPAFKKRDRDQTRDDREVLDIVIIGAGVSGMAAALEAKKLDLRFEVVEATEPFSTIVNFPKGKPIFTYPSDMTPAGELTFEGDVEVKEKLVADLKARTLEAGITPRAAHATAARRRGSLIKVELQDESSLWAHRVIVGIGRSGSFRRLDVPGEDRDKVFNRLHDPTDYTESDVLVVGGGDSAMETSIALAKSGARVTLSYRGTEFNRPKPENVDALCALIDNPDADVDVEEPCSERISTATGALRDRPHAKGSVQLRMASHVKEIRDTDVVLTDRDGNEETLPNDWAFVMIGREPPLDFFRRSGIYIRGEWRARHYTTFGLFLLFCLWLYHWKSDGLIPVRRWFAEHGWFPFRVPAWLDGISTAFATSAANPESFFYTLRTSMADPGFYYTFAYSLVIVIFGIRRIRRRKTPYVTWQTWTLMAIQVIPLFILPQILLPWMGRNGWFADGTMWGSIADQFFERYDDAGIERAYWRSYGFILAWPLFVANFFTDKPMWGWLIVGSVQTFVLIPGLIYFYGKGAYCGWICSCGALAETLGDTHRHKMPHGPRWNRLNMVGQVILAIALLLLLMRIGGWIWPGSFFADGFDLVLRRIPVLNYKWFVDLLLAGVVGTGFYFWFSGRVWCRFACPLAALMHIYARLSRFRILADKKKCISCNVCTSVCHQGIDVMNFANKGLPMEDPQCVRCSACVHGCPTGVLSFGQVDRKTGDTLRIDRLAASPVQMAEAVRERDKPN